MIESGRTNTELDPKQSDFFTSVKRIHEDYDLHFPLNGPWLTDHFKLADLIEERAIPMIQIREEIATKALEVYGVDSDEAISTDIFAQIGEHLDQIFMSQLRLFHGQPLSWKEANQDATKRLNEAIKNISENQAYQHFFATYPEFNQILTSVSELSEINTPADLTRLEKTLAKLALDLYERGGPTIVFNLEESILYHEGYESDNFTVLAARAQLFFEDNERNDYQKLVARLLQKHIDLHPSLSIKAIRTIIGRFVMGAGSELVSYTAGEGMELAAGLTIATNLFKNRAIREKVFALAGINFIPQIMEYHLLLYYLTHELGHNFTFVKAETLEELETDLPSVIITSEMALNRQEGLDLQTLLATLISDFAQQLMDKEPDADNLFYFNSSYFFLNKLFEYGLLKIIDEKIQLNASDSEVKEFITDLKTVFNKFMANDPETLAKLEKVDPTKNTATLLSLILKKDS